MSDLVDVAISLGIMGAGIIALWRHYRNELKAGREHFREREKELESRIHQRDDQIRRLNEDKQALSLDVVKTLGAFQATLSASDPTPMRDEIIAKLETMKAEILTELRRISD